MNNNQNDGLELQPSHASNILPMKSLSLQDNLNSSVVPQDSHSREVRGASSSRSSGRSKSASSRSSGRSSSRGRSVRSLSRESSLSSSASSSSDSENGNRSEEEHDSRMAPEVLSTKRVIPTRTPSQPMTPVTVNLHPAWLADGLVPNVVAAAFQVLMDLYYTCDGPQWRESTGWQAAASGSPPPNHVRVSYSRSPAPRAAQRLTNTAATGARREARSFGTTGRSTSALDEEEAAAAAALGRRQRRAGDRARAVVGAFSGWDGFELVEGYSHDSNGGSSADSNTGSRGTSLWQGLPGVELDLSHMGLQNALPPNAFAYRTAPASPYSSSSSSHTRHGRISANSSPLADTLVVLNLTANALTGPLPAGVSLLKRLQVLQVAHNAFTGSLPSSWLRPLTDLRTLNLSHNQLTGRVPQLWPNCIKLEVLDLSANGFSGRMPTKLSHLRYLRGIDLSYNAFEGLLPKVDLRQLKSLQYLRLHGNRKVVGVAPPSWRYFLNELKCDWDPDHLPSDVSSPSSDDDDGVEDDASSKDGQREWEEEEEEHGEGEASARYSSNSSGGPGRSRRRQQRRRDQQDRSRTDDAPKQQRSGRGRIREGSQERPQSSDSDSSGSSDQSAAEEKDVGHSDSSSDMDGGYGGGGSYNSRSSYSSSRYPAVSGHGFRRGAAGGGGGGGSYAIPSAGLRQGGNRCNERDGWDSSRSESDDEIDDEAGDSDHEEVGGRSRSGLSRHLRRGQRAERLLGERPRRSTNRRASTMGDCAPS